MKVSILFALLIVSALSVAFAGQGPAPAAPPPPCTPQGPGNVQFICGHDAPEDLVIVPGSEYVIASAYTAKGGLRMIRVSDKSTTVAYPAMVKEKLDAKVYDTCPGPPDAEEKAGMRSHGIAIREGKNSVYTLYVVNHTKRESIEVFEVDAKAKPPVLTWIGCAVAPDPIGLNEVLPLPDGGFIGTDFLARGDASASARMSAGEVNGALWEWHTGKGWKKIPGSEASGANGLEISKDGKTIYVAGWGNRSFFRLSLGQTPVKRDDITGLGFRPDNVRWAPDGQLFVTGQGTGTTNIVKIDPKTLKVQEIIKQADSPAFGAGTVTVQIGKELWVGSYRGDRVAVFPAPAASK